MIGCTIITPQYAEMGLEAAARFKRCTGLEVNIIWRNEEPAFEAKLEIPLILKDQTVVFFDSDLWFLHKTDLMPYANRQEFFAVQDPGVKDVRDISLNIAGSWAHNDCLVLGIDPLLYFNGGLWIANFRNPAQKLAFAIARQLCEDRKNGKFSDSRNEFKPSNILTKCTIGDYGEQTFLNAGIQRSQALLEFLPTEFNYWHMAYKGGLYQSIPYRIIGLHAAGYKTDQKLNHLRTMSDVFDVWLDKPRNELTNDSE